MSPPPVTRYAKSGNLNIAYQVIGEGPRDLVYVPGWVSNIEVMWEDPGLDRCLRRLASFSRLILFDKRGTGMSDPVSPEELPTLEQRMDDVRAVMDAVRSEKATLLGHSEGGNMSVLFAATYPERTEGLILTGSWASRIPSADYPWAPDPKDREAEIEETERNWGDPDALPDWIAPSRMDDEAFRNWTARYFRLGASPRAAANLLRMNTQMDTTTVLPTIRVPTLCVYRTGDHDVKIEEGRYIADRIPGARLVELPGADHFFWARDYEPFLQEVEEFVTGQRTAAGPERVLATVMFTDIVASTETATAMGDLAWRDLLSRHNAAVRAELERYRGREVETAGDGFLATFDGPARAIGAAQAITRAVKSLGIEVRVGVHTGEIEVMGGKVAGVSVHIGARISSIAEPGEVLVSRTVKDLVAGSGIEFRDRGVHALKGVTDDWQVFAVV